MTMKRRYLAITLALISGTAELNAQEPAVELDPIVITATRVPVSAATVSKTVITGEELQQLGIVQVADAIRLAGGAVSPTGSFGGQTTLYLRGGEGGYTRVLIDGVPVNNPGGDFNYAHLLTSDIERIELVRGPTSVLYGTDAVAGVLQIFTRRGTSDARVTLEARGGNYGSYSTAASLLGGGDRVNYGVSIGQYKTAGIHEFNSDYRNSYVSGSVELRPDDVSRVRISLRNQDRRFEAPTDGSGNVVDRNAFEFGETSTLGVDARRLLTDRLEGVVQLANYTSSGGFDDQADDAADNVGFFGFRSLDKIARRSADASVNFYATPGLVLTVGGQVEEEKQRSFSESLSEFGTSNGLFDVTRWNRAAYVQVAGGLGALSIQVGGRFDHNEAFGDFFTYRLGVGYALASKTTIRGAFGTAFREPTFFQNFAKGFATGNPDLDPEQTTSWEVGVDQALLHGNLQLNATLFDQDFEELIEFTFSPPNPGAPNFFNIAEASSRGIEFSVTYRAGAHVSLRGSYTYNDTKITQQGFDPSLTGTFSPGEQLLRRPDHVGSLTVGYAFSAGSFNVTTNHYGARDDIDFGIFDRVVLDSYTTVDIALAAKVYEGSGRTVTFEGRLANVFDEEFEVVSGFASPGRNVLAGFRLGL